METKTERRNVSIKIFLIRLFRTFEISTNMKTALGLVFPLLVLMLFLSIKNPRFLSVENLTNIVRQLSIYAIVGIGMTFVLAGGGIDLSVGSSIALTACIAGTILKTVNIPLVVPFAMIIAIIVGLLIGLFNGIVVSVFRIPPLIVTLGSLSIFRGSTYLLMKDRYRYAFPGTFTYIGQGNIASIPVPFIITMVVFIIGSIILHRAKFGRYVLSIGGSREAAKRAGIHITKYEILSYVIVGGLAALGGIILAARLNAVQSIIASGTELHIITVVVLGGTYLFGGYATILGTLLGALFLGVTENGLLIIGIQFYWQTIIVGILLILAVGIQLYRFRLSGVVSKE